MSVDRTGGPDGFHGPIGAAVAAFIASNWPAPDTTALQEALAARILSADPGSRSRDEIERYANSDRLAARIEWTMARETAKRTAEAEAQAGIMAKPIPPTWPGMGVPLADAQRRAGEALGTFATSVAAGECPSLLLKMTVGGGKTFAAIAALPAILRAGRAAGLGPVLFTHPRHALGDQIAADIRKTHPHLKVAVYRGREAENPAAPGQTMCQDLELSGAAVAASQGGTAACKACPIAQARTGCAYLAQTEASRGADVFVAPHQALFHTPFAGWPRTEIDGKKVAVRASAIIMDEDIASAGVAGMGHHPLQLALSALASDATPNLAGWDRERLLSLRGHVLEALKDAGRGGVFREAVAWMDSETGSSQAGAQNVAGEWARLEWDCKPRVKLGKSPSREKAMQLLQEAAAAGFSRLRPLLAGMVGDFLRTGDARSVNLTMELEADLSRGQGTGPAIRFAYRMDFHEAWRGPKLFLDATAQAEVLRQWAPDLEEVAIEVAAPHQQVVQVASHEFGRRMLTQPGNVSALVDVLLVELSQAAGAMLAVMQVGVERLVRLELDRRGAVRDPLPEGASDDDPTTYRFPSGAVLHLAHHGAVTGSNTWQDVAAMVVVGRPATDRITGERWGEVLGGKAVDVVQNAADSWWPTTTGAVRMADGTGYPTTCPAHPDALVEAYRWSVTEGAVMQAIGRCRGVRRTAANPVRVVVLAALALPLTVSEVVAWDDLKPDRLNAAAAEGALLGRALPLAPADMATARSDLWPSPKAAERFLEDRAKRQAGVNTPQSLIKGTYKGLGGINALAGARYRKPGSPRWSRALVPAVEGRAALEALLGPLAAYEAAPALGSTRPVSAASGGTSLAFRPEADPWLDVAAIPPLATTLHPPLPGEDLQPSRPPPAQAGLLGVIPGQRAAPVDPFPEPGSFEPDEEDLQPLDPGTPLPARAPGAWLAELRRRLDALPPPVLKNEPVSDFFIKEKHKVREDQVKAAWSIEWQAAWAAGRRLPPVEDGTT